MASRLDAAVGGHRRQDPSIVHADPRPLEAELGQGLGGREDELDLRDLGGHAEDIDVALGELPKAALLGSLGPPHRTDLDRLERVGQRGSIVRVVPRERHREIEAQPEIGEVVFTLRRRGVELRATLQDLVYQFLVLAPATAHQEPKVLERRRLDPSKAVPFVRGQDRGRRAVPKLHLGG